MRLHLAERDPQHHAWAKRSADKNDLRLRILLSYHYYKDIDLDALFTKYFTRPFPDVFADSGGFSAFTQGVEINWKDYAKWLARWQHLFSAYANLDVIGDTEGTAENQKQLEDVGLRPIPVFHTGSDWAVLEGLLEQYTYIALGGMVPHLRSQNRIMPWLIQCFKLAEGKAVYHGFGATSWQIVKSLPWYSVDSSSWGQGFRYGQVPVFDERRGKFWKLELGNTDHWRRHAWLVERLGFDPLDFADRSRNDRAKICAISALSYMLAERWLRKFHGEIYIPNDADVSGPRLHLADTSSGINFSDADKGVKLHLADARPSGGSEVAAAKSGLKIHLAEHSLDRGGG